MKRILITGANSYIGTSFEKFIKQFGADYQVDTVDMIDGSWRVKPFAGYDTVFHVAGIAHQKETKKNAHLYYDVNRDLAIETAEKAKADGVKQFVFLSSMSVYGMDVGVITKETLPSPKSNYAKSKLQAEEGIKKLNDNVFSICVLRPPMVYGNDCKGHYQTLAKIVKKSPVFPKVENERSMVSIDTLSRFIKDVIDNNKSGLYFPQNKSYVRTIDLAIEIADSMNKKIRFSRLLGILICGLKPFSKSARKAFGTLIYRF